MTAHTMLVIGAWTFGALALLLLSGGFVLGPAGENLGGRLYRRESERIEQRQLLARLTAAQEDVEPGEVPAPVEPNRTGLLAWMRRPLDRLKARNEAILKEREARQ